MSETAFEIVALRVTENLDREQLGLALVRTHPFTIELSPIIETGRTHTYPPGAHHPTYRFKEPDTFRGWEFVLTDNRKLWRRDRKLWRLLRKDVALEFWTRQTDAPGWIHWLMPYTTWEKVGTGVYSGLSHNGPGLFSDEVPDGQLVTEGAFWKTTIPPPEEPSR